MPIAIYCAISTSHFIIHFSAGGIIKFSLNSLGETSVFFLNASEKVLGLPQTVGCKAIDCLERPVEGPDAQETGFIGYFDDGLSGVFDQFLGFICAYPVQVGIEVHAGGFAKEAGEVKAAEIDFAGDLLQRDILGMIFFKVFKRLLHRLDVRCSLKVIRISHGIGIIGRKLPEKCQKQLKYTQVGKLGIQFLLLSHFS